MRKGISEAVDAFKPDVIHVMYGGVMADQIVRHHHVCPIVVTFRGSDLLGENLSGWMRKIVSHYGVICSRRAAHEADGVVVVARHLIGALNGTAKPEKIRVIPSGIDLNRFKPMDSLACKNKLGWKLESFHVVFASSSGDPVKRPRLAQAAVEHSKRLGCPAEFHFITGIPSSEVPLWMNAADALLMTSLHEGSPNVVKEALACGLPVVSVEVGDVVEQINGMEGCHLSAPEPAALASQLRSVWMRGKRLDCHEKREDLSALSVAWKLEQFYKEIIGASESAPKPTPEIHFAIPVDFPADTGTTFAKPVKSSRRENGNGLEKNRLASSAQD
jgi:glycosyltransferase involved in cell wall biosynthesis